MPYFIFLHLHAWKGKNKNLFYQLGWAQSNNIYFLFQPNAYSDSPVVLFYLVYSYRSKSMVPTFSKNTCVVMSQRDLQIAYQFLKLCWQSKMHSHS